MKPGIMVLLVLEAITALVVAARTSNQALELTRLGWLTIAGVLSAGGSAAINQYIERNKDALMSRTDWRPVATHKVTPRNALAFGVGSVVLGLVISLVFLNLLTMVMMLLGALSYIFLYTMYLKPRTSLNIVIGGIAGVFPALAGWASVTQTIQWPALFIGLLVFLWTPPHFWGLSLKYKKDYEKTGYPMLSVVKTERQVINWIVLSSIPLFVLSLLPFVISELGVFDFLYYGLTIAVTIPFVYVDVKMLRQPTVRNGFNAFLISLPYLFVVFAGMIASSII
jgi:heme o synthase